MCPSVSIVMPVRNEERIVSRAIDSVINQTFSDWELVIVDDASNDLTPKILSEYENKDPRIRVLRNNRCLGITKSINKGIRASMGRFIARLDADDWYHPDKLEEQVKFLESHPDHGVVGTFFILVTPDGDRLKIDLPVNHEQIMKRMAYRNAFCHSCVMMRKDVLEKVGLYNERLRYAQDYDLFFRILSVSKGANIPKYLCYRTFRKHPKRRMLESTVNSIVTPLKYWRVLGRNVIYYPLLFRRIVALIRILFSLY